MEKLSLWLKISSVSAIISAVTLALIPESKLKSTFITISSFIVIFSLFSAFDTVRLNDFDFYKSEEEVSLSLEEKSNDLIGEEGERVIDKLLKEKLDEAGFEVKCKSNLTEGENGFEIKNITVYGTLTNEEKEAITRLINENIKGVSEVFFEEEINEE